MGAVAGTTRSFKSSSDLDHAQLSEDHAARRGMHCQQGASTLQSRRAILASTPRVAALRKDLQAETFLGSNELGHCRATVGHLVGPPDVSGRLGLVQVLLLCCAGPPQRARASW